jgi:hypothetical protein
MAKPITTTPTIKGMDAVRIVREIQRGTPNTPARERMIRESDNVYRRHAPIQERQRAAS